MKYGIRDMRYAIPNTLNALHCPLHAVARSTPVENIRQITPYLKKKANFVHFSPKYAHLTKKQTQFKSNKTKNKPNFEKSNFKILSLQNAKVANWTISPPNGKY
jgi:hypothetical protein